MLEQLDLALLLQVTSLILLFVFCFVCFSPSCSTNISPRARARVRVMWKSRVECEETRLLERQKKCFRLTMAKMSVLAGQGSNIFQLAGVGPAAGRCSFSPQSDFSLVSFKVGLVLKPFQNAFGPQEQKGLTL